MNFMLVFLFVLLGIVIGIGVGELAWHIERRRGPLVAGLVALLCIVVVVYALEVMARMAHFEALL